MSLAFFQVVFPTVGKTKVFPTVGKTIVFPTEWKNKSFSSQVEKLEFFQPSGKTEVFFSKIGFLQAKPEPPALSPLVRVWCEQMVMRNSLAC